MDDMKLSRRGLITGLGSLFLAAPAIVRASSLMPVSSLCLPKTWFVDGHYWGSPDWKPFCDVPGISVPLGQSWSTAFGRLADALAVMRPGDSLYARDTHIEMPMDFRGAKEVILQKCMIQ